MAQRLNVTGRRLAARTHLRRRCLHAAASADSAVARPAIDFDDLIDVIKAVDSSDVVEMELKGKRFAMIVRKQEALKALEPVYVQAAAPAAGAPAAPAPAAPAPAAAAPVAQAPPAPSAGPVISGVEIVAPMSGTVYRKPAPGEPRFCQEGDKVAKGQSICIIEAMKLMNEIEADVSGTVVKFVAEDAGNIEPGDVICIIDPN